MQNAKVKQNVHISGENILKLPHKTHSINHFNQLNYTLILLTDAEDVSAGTLVG